MGSVLKCGYDCGAQATVDFLWPNDAEVWHVCDAHASALQKMLDEQRGSEWAARVVRWPTQSANGESGPRPNVSDDAMTSAEDTTEPSAEPMVRLGRRMWPLLWRIRSWLSRAR
jgi:hypothetical protein